MGGLAWSSCVSDGGLPLMGLELMGRTRSTRDCGLEEPGREGMGGSGLIAPPTLYRLYLECRLCVCGRSSVAEETREMRFDWDCD